MRVLVCGGRNYGNLKAVWDELDGIRLETPHDAMIVIQGGARGADKLAREWCSDRRVSYFNFTADWRTHGKSAGPIRNQRMLDEGKPDLVVAFPGGDGTADMVKRARQAAVRVIEIEESMWD